MFKYFTKEEEAKEYIKDKPNLQVIPQYDGTFIVIPKHDIINYKENKDE